MYTGSYPKLDTEWSPPDLRGNRFTVRSLVPLCAPPSPSTLPALPSRPRTSLLHPEWTLTTHLVPAAYPRTTPFIPVPPIPPFNKDKQKRKAEMLKLGDELAGVKRKQARGELDELGRDQSVLWCCVNRYVRAGATAASDETKEGEREGRGLTLFFAHANGFPKEIWEPMLVRLVNERARTSSFGVTEIWCWEAVNHGDSALVNADKLSGIYDWQDNARDISHFLLHYLPASTLCGSLPTHLPRLPSTASAPREQHGFLNRRLVGVGHSFGGCSLVWSASHEPFKRLFSSIIFIDPIIEGSQPASDAYSMSVSAMQRRDHWSSRDVALGLFKASPFFQAWDPAVLDLYIQCGLYDDPKGGVRLKMAPIHEAITFAERLSVIEAWNLIPKIEDRVELMFIMPGGNGEPGGPEKIADKRFLVWRRPTNSSNIINSNAGHLIPQETPQELAEDIQSFLQKKYGMPKSRL